MNTKVALAALFAVASVLPLSSFAQSLSADAGQDDNVCSGSAKTLGGNPTASGGVGGYGYLWQPSTFLDDSLAPNPKSRPLVQMTYILTVTDTAGNTAKDTIVISVDTLPIVNITGQDTAYCNFGTRDTLMGTPLGGYFYGTGIVSTNVFDPYQAGPGVHFSKYLFTDNNGCVGLDSVQMNVLQPAPVSIDPIDSVICENADPIPLSASPPGGDLAGPGVINDTLYPNLVGVGQQFPLHYILMDSIGCMSSTELFYDVVAKPNIQFTGITGPICSGNGAVTLSATPIGGVFSGDGVKGGIFYPDSVSPGIHYITYTVANKDSCWSTDSLDVTVITSPIAEFQSPGDSFCLSDAPVSLGGSPLPGVFTGPGVMGSGFDPAQAGAGQHTLMYVHTDQYGCKGRDSVSVFVNAGPTASIAQNGTKLTASGGVTYEWFKNGALVSGAIGPVYTMITSGDYYAKVFDAQGCYNKTDTINHVFDGLNDIFDSRITLYPNPGEDRIDFTTPSTFSISGVKIYNLLGVLMVNVTLNHGMKTSSIDTKSLSSGVYLLKFESQKGSVLRKWMKK